MKIIAIHQPNFFPWLGYFDKIRRADAFVILDDVQFQKTGGTWSNRVKLLVAGKPQWVTMPIVRAYHGVLSYRDIQINDQTEWREKLLRTLTINYIKAPFYDEVFPHIDPLVRFKSGSLTEFNIHAIKSLCEKLGLPPEKIALQSEIPVSGAATDLLISITRALNGTGYLCGAGALGYQEDQKFVDAGLDLIYQDFNHPVYPQLSKGDFVPGCSIIDALMNCGFSGTAALLNGSISMEQRNRPA